jgi:tetratricopeptide (TPR) repeat protein
MRRMRALPLVVLLAVAAAAPAAAEAPPPAARALKDAGDARARAGDVAGALDAYRAAVKEHPAYADAYAAIGRVHYAAGAHADAALAYGRSVEIDPAFAAGWYNLGLSARRAGDLARARAAYERYVALRPADADGHLGLAETLRALGDRVAAVRAYEAFLGLAHGTPAQAPWVEKARAALSELRALPAAGANPAAPVTPATAIAGVEPQPGPASPATAAPDPATASGSTGASGTGLGIGTPPATSAGTATPTTVPAQSAAAGAAPSAAVLAKLDQGDRALAAGDARGALFAYQDAVYLQPGSAAARVRLGRAYLALRYPAQAQAQAEQVLARDPASADARRLLDDCRNPPAHATSPATVGAIAVPVSAPATPAITVAVPSAAPPRVPEPAPPAAGHAAPRVYRLPDAEPDAEEPAREAPPAVTLVAQRVDAPAPDAPRTAAQRYRTALDLISRRAYAEAVAELDDAIAREPSLAVAFAARASAQFGLGRHRDAADDYAAALRLDPALATPLYGLAECYRVLGDGRAGELYRRYAESRARDVREDLRATASRRAAELSRR